MYMAADNARELTVKVNVDISEALTGLKAVQREAKEATRALRSLEAANGGSYIRLDSEVIASQGRITVEPGKRITGDSVGVQLGLTDTDRHVTYFAKSSDKLALSNDDWVAVKAIPTAILQRELAKREGVEVIEIDAHGGYAKLSVDNSDEGSAQVITGPAIVTVNRD